MSNFIKVWCEYDINGSFGGNNNEEVFEVIGDVDIDQRVFDYVSDATGLSEEDLDGLYDWEWVTISKFEKGD